MPVCEISYSPGLLDEEQRDRRRRATVGDTHRSRRFAGQPDPRSLCQISISEPAFVYIGGAPSFDAKIVVKIYAFSDAYTDSVKADVYRRIARLFCEHHPASAAQGGRNVWCMVLPIESNGFGVGGIPVSLEMTKKIVTSGAGRLTARASGAETAGVPACGRACW